MIDYDSLGHNEALTRIALYAVDLYDIEPEALRTTLRVLDLLTAGADRSVETMPGRDAPNGTFECSRFAWAVSEAQALQNCHEVIDRLIAIIEASDQPVAVDDECSTCHGTTRNPDNDDFKCPELCEYRL